MLLGYSLTPFGHHPDAWRQAQDGSLLGFDALLEQVSVAEAAGFDFVLLDDRLGIRPTDNLSPVAVPFEPTLLASALVTRAGGIGILAAASTAQHEPYNLARRFASLDLISEGRSGWLAVNGGTDPAREHEYLDVVTALWDSFEDDAFLYDKASGRFFDPGKMHVVHHKGAHLSVRGPLNVNRSPQGRPVLAQIVSEGDGPLAVQTGELFLLHAKSPEGLIEIARKATREIEAAGKGKGEIKLLANLVPVVATSKNAANEASATLKLTEQSGAAQPLSALPIVGTASVVADRLQELSSAASLDGFTILPPTLEMGQRFLAEVVPELRRRGVVDAKFAGTLRDRLGLRRPVHPASRHPEVSR